MVDPVTSLIIGLLIIVSLVWIYLPKNGILAHWKRSKKNTHRVLIENSLKHAISTYPDGGVIDILIVIKAQRLIITISDDGKLTTPGNGSGLGLKNLQSRLQSIYDDNYQLESGFAAEGGFKVNIELPVHREEA